MVVTPAGEVVSSLDLYKEGILTAEVQLLSGETFYARHGDRPLLWASLVLVVLAAWLSRRAPAV
jgi:apolipoprotein N-acyltransferase